jgi:hypothetical protein
MRVPRTLAVFWPVAVCGVLAASGPLAASDPPATLAPRPFIPPAAAPSLVAEASDPNTRVYLLNGADPFGWAGLSYLADRIRTAGYPYTRYGEAYDIWGFEHEIRVVHREDPNARFVLIGFSYGTLVVREAARRLLRDGIQVAMLGYVGGDYLGDTAYSRPAGVGRVVNVTGNGFLLTGRNLFWNGTDLSGAANLRLRANHFWLPTHPQTYRMLLAGLTEVSAGGSGPPM